ncbi:TetR/AcrR family transcriptional regulator [Mycolicibacterium sp. 3033]|nr:TetR/AcrR family transcriptional regulator [Mycolicibacterium aurantiacum]
MTEVLSRSERKRGAIMAAAGDLFLAHGYQGTSVDQIAASAAVSKQTVYKHFGEKQELLLAIVRETVDNVVEPFLERVAGLVDTTEVETDLLRLAEEYLRSVMQESVVQLRRLVVGEANGSPGLAEEYYDHAPSRVLDGFATLFDAWGRRGILRVAHPDLAAEHFAFLVVGRCLDQALFCGGQAVLARVDIERHVGEAVRVFLGAYRD